MTQRSEPKKIVYLVGAGATQAELSHKGGVPCNLLMMDNKKSGIPGVSSNVISRANLDRKFGLRPGTDTDIEKLISLLSATGRYQKEIDETRESYFEVIVNALNEKELLKKPELAIALLEMHQSRFFKKKEILSGIISLNHDSLFQLASQKVFGGINLGFRFASSSFYKYSSNLPLILHLHGAFNWRNSIPIEIFRLSTEKHKEILWIPPSILKESKEYPFNKLMGLSFELLSKECTVLRIIGCSLSQNDWNLISLIFNAQSMQQQITGAPFNIELIMDMNACKRIEQEYSYFQNIIPIGNLQDGLFDAYLEFDKAGEIPKDSELNNPFKFWLKAKLNHHISKSEFVLEKSAKTLKKIIGE